MANKKIVCVEEPLVIVKRTPVESETAFVACLQTDGLTPAHFAEVIAHLIHHAAARFDIPATEMFDLVQHDYANHGGLKKNQSTRH